MVRVTHAQKETADRPTCSLNKKHDRWTRSYFNNYLFVKNKVAFFHSKKMREKKVVCFLRTWSFVFHKNEHKNGFLLFFTHFTFFRAFSKNKSIFSFPRSNCYSRNPCKFNRQSIKNKKIRDSCLLWHSAERGGNARSQFRTQIRPLRILLYTGRKKGAVRQTFLVYSSV
jgi:hypothetical protein